jgi:hypothetical protein
MVLLMALLWPMQTALGARWAEKYSKVSLFYLYYNWQEESDDGEHEIGEGVFGVKAHQVFSPRFTVDFWGAMASASYADSEPDGTEISFSSLSDTRLKGTYFFQDRLFSAAVSLNLPTGKTSLSDDEYLVAIGVADNSRKYIVRRFGQGLDLGGELFILPHSGNVEFQFGGGYLHKGGYQLRDEPSTEYKFGDELFAKASVEIGSRPVGFYGNITIKSYSEDEADSRTVFQQGNTVQVNGRLIYTQQTRGAVGFSFLSRGTAKVSATGGELTEESIKSGRDELLLYVSGNHPLSPRLRALGRLEYKSVTANDYPEDSVGYRPGGSYLGLGGGLNARFSLNWSASLMATYYTGGMDNDHDLTGLGLAAVLTFRYW